MRVLYRYGTATVLEPDQDEQKTGRFAAGLLSVSTDSEREKMTVCIPATGRFEELLCPHKKCNPPKKIIYNLEI